MSFTSFRNTVFNTPEKCWDFIKFMKSYNGTFEKLYYELLRMNNHNHDEFMDYLQGMADNAYNRNQFVKSICGDVEY